ncbi:hypothetical protein RRG08_044619 [Elysia crispata]|uniref:SDR family oxidoreductase n=1 Tax=Elysia crispata TaxID=231223 RepID=A0AAE1D122_9GAST|nr:hypothetical protein RRG08_044619 [Elysia crispata]
MAPSSRGENRHDRLYRGTGYPRIRVMNMITSTTEGARRSKPLIRTNCVNPTVTMTQMGVYAWSDPAKSGPVLNRIPLGKFAEVEDVVNAVLFLLSDKAAYINGATLPVEGGLLVA